MGENGGKRKERARLHILSRAPGPYLRHLAEGEQKCEQALPHGTLSAGAQASMQITEYSRHAEDTGQEDADCDGQLVHCTKRTTVLVGRSF